MTRFKCGDVVKYVSKDDDFWTVGEEHIIHEEVYLYNQGEFEYTTNRGAWFTAEDFELVRLCDDASLAALDNAIGAEEDDDE